MGLLRYACWHGPPVIGGLVIVGAATESAPRKQQPANRVINTGNYELCQSKIAICRIAGEGSHGEYRSASPPSPSPRQLPDSGASRRLNYPGRADALCPSDPNG